MCSLILLFLILSFFILLELEFFHFLSFSDFLFAGVNQLVVILIFFQHLDFILAKYCFSLGCDLTVIGIFFLLEFT